MQLGGCDPAGAHVLFVDGSTGILPVGTPPSVIRAMSTIDQGDAAPAAKVRWNE
jgi:hypothetical protein